MIHVDKIPIFHSFRLFCFVRPTYTKQNHPEKLWDIFKLCSDCCRPRERVTYMVCRAVRIGPGQHTEFTDTISKILQSVSFPFFPPVLSVQALFRVPDRSLNIVMVNRCVETVVEELDMGLLK
jgi:hypothetical protein